MCTVEKVSPFLLHLPEDIKPEELFHCISQIKISRKKYDRVRLKVKTAFKNVNIFFISTHNFMEVLMLATSLHDLIATHRWPFSATAA